MSQRLVDRPQLSGDVLETARLRSDLISNDDGSLTLELSPNGYREDWPMGEDLFFDFHYRTNSSEPAPPVWTEESPSNGTLVSSTRIWRRFPG